jgi:hypothetical protein
MFFLNIPPYNFRLSDCRMNTSGPKGAWTFSCQEIKGIRSMRNHGYTATNASRPGHLTDH